MLKSHLSIGTKDVCWMLGEVYSVVQCAISLRYSDVWLYFVYRIPCRIILVGESRMSRWYYNAEQQQSDSNSEARILLHRCRVYNPRRRRDCFSLSLSLSLSLEVYVILTLNVVTASYASSKQRFPGSLSCEQVFLFSLTDALDPQLLLLAFFKV